MRSVPSRAHSHRESHRAPAGWGRRRAVVALIDQDGTGELYLRDLEFKDTDWFYVGMADITLAMTVQILDAELPGPLVNTSGLVRVSDGGSDFPI